MIALIPENAVGIASCPAGWPTLSKDTEKIRRASSIRSQLSICLITALTVAINTWIDSRRRLMIIDHSNIFQSIRSRPLISSPLADLTGMSIQIELIVTSEPENLWRKRVLIYQSDIFLANHFFRSIAQYQVPHSQSAILCEACHSWSIFFDIRLHYTSSLDLDQS
eukprot:scaffold179885_cov57-Attheya_sp.AAC.1